MPIVKKVIRVAIETARETVTAFCSVMSDSHPPNFSATDSAYIVNTTTDTDVNMEQILQFMRERKDLFDDNYVKQKVDQLWNAQMQQLSTASTSSSSSSSAAPLPSFTSSSSQLQHSKLKSDVTPQPLWQSKDGGGNLIEVMERGDMMWPPIVNDVAKNGVGIRVSERPDTNGFFKNYQHAKNFVASLKTGSQLNCFVIFYSSFHSASTFTETLVKKQGRLEKPKKKVWRWFTTRIQGTLLASIFFLQ